MALRVVNSVRTGLALVATAFALGSAHGAAPKPDITPARGAANVPLPPPPPPRPVMTPPPVTTGGATNAGVLSPLAALGEKIFHDPSLSNPKGTACVACHQASSGYSDGHGSNNGVALGSTSTSFGLRNPLQSAYNAGVPPFGFVLNANGNLEPRGGHFWDGRSNTLAEQALLPFLNPVEMNNPSAAAVVAGVAAAPYSAEFERIFGPSSLTNTSQAFTQIGLAIQAYEQSRDLQRFTSKYDAVITGKATFTASEQRGMALFTNRATANCASCHAMNPNSKNPADSPFSSFSYHATGVPRNSAIAQNRDSNFYDLGLCGPERSAPTTPPGVAPDSLCGKFRTPSLRNVALRQRYMHNGFFTNLTDVVTFYATRASDPQRWYGPSGVPNDLPAPYLKNLANKAPPFNRTPATGAALTPTQISDLVAFLDTLSDGFVPR